MTNRPDWDGQFAETECERAAKVACFAAGGDWDNCQSHDLWRKVAKAVLEMPPAPSSPDPSMKADHKMARITAQAISDRAGPRESLAKDVVNVDRAYLEVVDRIHPSELERVQGSVTGRMTGGFTSER